MFKTARFVFGTASAMILFAGMAFAQQDPEFRPPAEVLARPSFRQATQRVSSRFSTTASAASRRWKPFPPAQTLA